MKVSIVNGNKDILYDEIKGRPFSFNTDRFEYTPNLDEADYILGYLHYKNANEDYHKIIKNKNYKDYHHKMVFFAMHDKPRFAYKDKKTIKFICQPLHGEEVNKEYNIIPVPLQMRHYELNLIRNHYEFIKKNRENKKEHNYIFIGAVNNDLRKWVKKLKLQNYKFENGTRIFGIKKVNQRLKIIKNFCKTISKSYFGFAPKGVGTSSFRLYQCMMMGTIPIIHGMKDYPFKEELNWHEFSIIEPSLDEIKKLADYDSEELSKMRSNCIDIWEKYFRIPNTDRYIFDKYLKIDLDNG